MLLISTSLRQERRDAGEDAGERGDVRHTRQRGVLTIEQAHHPTAINTTSERRHLPTAPSYGSQICQYSALPLLPLEVLGSPYGYVEFRWGF
ncbi:hypothetical protein PM082_022424 [Marasmius tenuissimus]|nr:hypothetical protein PM082_022424 [Marasmius tenuissimus]